VTSKLKRLVLPLYLALCIVIGGSSQTILPSAILQVAAIAMLVWAIAARASEQATAPSRRLLLLLGLFALLAIIQLLPLPPGLWSALPGRAIIAQGFAALGYALPWQPLSMTPYATVASALALLPPVAVLLMGVRHRQREAWLAATLVLCTLIGVLLGAVQLATGGPASSAAYFYEITNDGAVGFFANRNHMGSLLVVGIPFGVALFASASSLAQRDNKLAGVTVFAVAALLVVLAGVALNRSLAALSLALPVILFSGLLLPPSMRLRRFALPAGALALVATMMVLVSSSIGDELTGSDTSSFTSRAEIWDRTSGLIGKTLPMGTGLGSFVSVYPLAEDPADATRTFVNHAHNDLLELTLELGAAGVILLLLFLAWWGRQVVRVWRTTLSTVYARAATIGSGALLGHSLVDYPLRTPALAAVFALCLALMTQPWLSRRSSERAAVRPTKHVTIG